MATLPNTKIAVDCPRCAGRGIGTWHPDNGICYRCGGKRVVNVNPYRLQRALGFLRGKWVTLRNELEAQIRLGNARAVSLVQEQLTYCEVDGRRIRHELSLLGYENV